MKWKAIVACLLWGSAFVAAKIGFEYMPPILLSGFRFTLAGLLLLPFIFSKKIDIIDTVRKNWRFMTLFAFAQTFMQYGLFFMGLNKVSASTSAIIIGAGPLFVAIMAHFAMKDDRITLKKMVAIFLGILGVVFISLKKGGFSSDNPGFYLGVALLLSSNLVGGYTNIMVAKHDAKISPVLLTSFANFTGGLMLVFTGLLLESFPAELPSFKFYLSLLWLAMIPAAGFSIWYTLLQKPGVKVSELNMLKFIIPVTGCVLSWLILPGESPDMTSVYGIIVITIALQILQMPQRYFNRIEQILRIVR